MVILGEMMSEKKDHVSIRIKRESDIEAFQEIKDVVDSGSNIGVLRRLMLFYMRQSPAYRYRSSSRGRGKKTAKIRN